MLLARTSVPYRYLIATDSQVTPLRIRCQDQRALVKMLPSSPFEWHGWRIFGQAKALELIFVNI